ncbi:MAG: prepilin-type N-terminal cleavage/methylation domain-containing protein [Aquabacterium sp.]|uniref:prepilin-type N-terminal cleavage/methylation domain-containing protein n=1 Tax=Aquabacterium sp. TaxID=1872578 RepID=UPI0025C243F5|nr:prepilin-type N-terminal cleavage/methylation domain-containing protein [Aquabacterium sp.]MBI5924377.1 prepilin-type N-terminal cleavage/methylation domain-containing protein [Aquabacterium sp.]
MPISVPGSKARRARGFTLLELMVVVAMIAITTAVVSFAIPDPSATRLEREAARLIALLESARTQARAGAMTVLWVPQPNGPEADYQFLGMPPALMPPLKWLEPDVKAEVAGAKSIVLGPEPVIGAQSVILRLEDKQIIISTDGLSAFDVLTGDADQDNAEGEQEVAHASGN